MPSGYTNRVWKGKLCGAYEIAEFAKVTKAQIAHWSKEEWFPKTVDEPRMGRVWNYQEVVAALTAKGYPLSVSPSGRKIRIRKSAVPAAADEALEKAGGLVPEVL